MIIVLQHGLFGFAGRKVGPMKVEYFAGIPDALRRAGHTPITTGVNPIGGVTQRAAQLRSQIVECLSARPANEKILIIGHSMGGLDAREMLARSGADLAPRIAAVLTIATPHHGSPIADLVMSLRERVPAAIRRLFPEEQGEGVFLPWLDVNQDAIPNLTTGACAAFNRTTQNAGKVRYFWVAADCTRNVPFFFKQTYAMVAGAPRPAGGPNDGVVSVESARPPDDPENPWIGLGTWPVDHLNVVNMRLPNDPSRPDVAPRYLNLLRQLNQAGIATPTSR